MEFVPPSALSTGAFLVICIAVVAMWIAAVYAAHREQGPILARKRALSMTAFLVIWAGATAAFVLSGAVSRRGPPPGLVVFFAGSNLVVVAMALSPIGRRLSSLSSYALIGFQVFRLPLELVLHNFASVGTIPEQMTFQGHNFDIVTGGLSLLVLLVYRRREVPRGIAWGFNLVGTALLLVVAFIAVTSSPIPFKLYQGQPLLLGLEFPYAWIVPLCVAPALGAHILLFRKLLNGRR